MRNDESPTGDGTAGLMIGGAVFICYSIGDIIEIGTVAQLEIAQT